MADKKSTTAGVETMAVKEKEPKGKSLDDEVEVYDPAKSDMADEDFFDPDAAKKAKEEKQRAESQAAHEKEVRGRPVEQIFAERMSLSGGTTPREAGAEVVMVKEYGEKLSKAKRQERIGIWTEKFIKWAKDQGKEIRSEGGGLIGIGDRIEIMQNGHYRYKW